MNRKAKQRFAKYKSTMAGMGRVANRIFMPNDTRAAGVQMFYNAMILSRWNLACYWYEVEETGDVQLTNKEFVELAELEAVLYPLALLTKLLQTNRFGSGSYSFLYTYRCYQVYATQDVWYVADVCKQSNSDRKNWWHAGATFPARTYFGHPDKEKEMPNTQVCPMVQINPKKRAEMTLVARMLIARIEKEFRNYTAMANNNQLIAMACNPLTANVGMRELTVQSYKIQSYSILENDSQPFAYNYTEASKTAVIKEIKKVCSEMLVAKAVPVFADDQTTSTASINDIDQLYAFVDTREKKRAKVVSQNPVEEEVNKFFNNETNWHGILKHSKASPCPASLLKKIGSNQLDYVKKWEMIAERFNIMEWWEDVGKSQYPYIYVLACIILPLPDSNGSQERTFSSATWMDGKLNKRQSDATFQMKVILQQNSAFMDRDRIAVIKEEHMAAAAESTKQLVKEAMERRRKEIDGNGSASDAEDNTSVASTTLEAGSPLESSDSYKDEVDDEEEAVEELYE
jgi:hypothetical protein